MAIQYDNFDLLIEHTGDGFKARVLDSPGGEAAAQFRLPYTQSDVENFFVQIGHTRLIETSQMQKMRVFGQELFEATFTGNVRDKFRESLIEVNRNRKGLRIRLRVADVPELANLPWEFMYDASLSRFLTLSIETPLVRYLDVPRDIQPLAIHPPLQILSTISSPRNFPTLNVQHEWNNLQEALNRLESRGMVKLTITEKPTLQSLQRQLRRGEYHIFHFIGHGVFSKLHQDGQLLFEDEMKSGDPVSSRDLGILLHDHRHLRLAVLNACEGARTSLEDQFAGTAQSLMLQGLPAVIAMQFRITDIAAITLAREFYAALADGYPVDAALTEARKAIKTHGNELEWGTPVLYMRSPSGAIFDVKSLPPSTYPVQPISGLDAGTEKQLTNLYTEGLEAFYLKEWEKAILKFQAITDIQSGYKDVAKKLDIAQNRLKLFSLDEHAKTAEADGNWEAATKALEILSKEFPKEGSFSERLKEAQRQRHLSNLYDEARQLAQAEKWSTVTHVFAEIHSQDPQYADPEGLLARAQEAVAAQKLRDKLQSLYQNALQAIDDKHWLVAQQHLQQILAKQEGYREVKRLLQTVNLEIERLEKEKEEGDKIASLYIEAENLVHHKQWQKTLEKIEEIRKIQPNFDDPDQVAAKANAEIEKLRLQEEKQNQLAELYAETVKASQSGEYQQALDKWNQIRAIDSRYPDKQRVQSTARKMLKKQLRIDNRQTDSKIIEIDIIRKVPFDWELTKQVASAFLVFMLSRAILEIIFKLVGVYSTIEQTINRQAAVLIYTFVFGGFTATALWWTFRNSFTSKNWKGWGNIVLSSAITFALIFYGIYYFFSPYADDWIWTLAWAIIGPAIGLILFRSIWQDRTPFYQKFFWQLPVIWLFAFILGQQVAGEIDFYLTSMEVSWHNEISLTFESGLAGLIGSMFTFIHLKSDPIVRRKLNYLTIGFIFVSLIIFSLITGLQQFQRIFLQEPFAGAIGEWKGKDPADQGILSLTIQRSLFSGNYTITYVDDTVNFCHDGPARATITRKVDGFDLHRTIPLQCDDYRISTFKLLDVRYDQEEDELVDNLSKNRWIRK